MVTFLLSLLTKESNSAACGRKLLILPLASKALELQSFEAFKAASRIKSVPPLKRRVTFFCLKQQKKGNQRKMLFLNQVPARSVHSQARATRDILSRWRAAHIHVRRPSGVLLLTRATGLAALVVELDIESCKDFEAKGRINSFRPQAAELLSFVKSDKRKVTKEKRFL